MKSRVVIEAGGRTPSGLVLPNRSKPVTMDVITSYHTENVWSGNINFNKPQTIEKRVPKQIQFRTEFVFLITKFLEHHKKDTTRNSSLTMLLDIGGEFAVLEVSRTAKRITWYCRGVKKCRKIH